ncbi:MAG TPA: TIGR03790 family protein [Lacipirellulaceae bacterium]|nr:TIGR03790 family protein [Lacipirellulaceae bacterium]
MQRTLRHLACAFAILLPWMCDAGVALAGGGPENVFVVVNPRGAASREVANHYIALRRIPAANVFYLPAPPIAPRLTGLDFREKILRPILTEIKNRGLEPSIDVIAYSAEFPWQIDCSNLLGVPDAPGPNRPMASLTGATYLYQFVEQADPSLVELGTNFYCPPAEEPQTTRAFHRRTQWRRGEETPAGGVSYLMAVQLGSTQPEGNTVAEIVSYLERSATADGARPQGTFYYMKNADIRSRARDAGYPAAVTAIKALQLKAELGSGVVPLTAEPILGLTTGAQQVALRTAGSLAPGALVDNLTSNGGMLSRAQGARPQTRLSAYLRLGAAGASGTVVEPLAIAQKFPSPWLHVHYARGASMAEAFYRSVQGPYQLLIVGDPLCQPWAFVPTVTVEGASEGAILSGQVEITPAAKLRPSRALRRFEFYVDGRARGTRALGQTFKLDTTKLPDGYHELRVVAVDDSPVETQGRWIAGVMVKNGRDAVSVSSAAGPVVSGASATLSLTATVEGPIALFHNGREVGRGAGPKATLELPLDKLGRGPVALEARTLGSVPLRSPPLLLEVR